MPAPAPAAARLRWALPLLGLAGLGLGLAYLAAVVTSDDVGDPAATATIGLLVGWSFLGTGLFAWWRRPANRTGLLMAAVGLAWLATGLGVADDDVLHTVGIALDGFFPALIAQLVLAFPGGRLQTRGQRAVVVGAYLVGTVLQLPSLLFEEDPRNLLVVEPDQALSDALDAVQFGGALLVTLGGVAVGAARWTSASPPLRRAFAPVVVAGGLALVVFAIAAGVDAAGSPQPWLERISEVLLAALPFAFLAGLLRSRLSQASAMAELVDRLGQAPRPDELRAALAHALGDPSLRLAYWLADVGRFVDAEGRALELVDGTWTEVELHGRRIAAIVHDPALTDQPQLVHAAGAAAALVLENQRLSAELRARIEELRASRARLVQATDAERRRLERDLHDGAQSRLVALALKLRLARLQAGDEAAVGALLDESATELQASLQELRELARGINPAALAEHGLGVALQTLADRAPVPVELDGRPPDGLPRPVTTAIYFVVSEALTNVAKYAQAGQATVAVRRDGDVVVIEVADDGVGGADAAAGSGLRGLSDRLAALDGRLEVHSPPGAGTRLHAEIPLT